MASIRSDISSRNPKNLFLHSLEKILSHGQCFWGVQQTPQTKTKQSKMFLLVTEEVWVNMASIRSDISSRNPKNLFLHSLEKILSHGQRFWGVQQTPQTKTIQSKVFFSVTGAIRELAERFYDEKLKSSRPNEEESVHVYAVSCFCHCMYMYYIPVQCTHEKFLLHDSLSLSGLRSMLP